MSHVQSVLMELGLEHRTRKVASLISASLLMLTVSMSPVQAQSSDVQALLDRMNRLEADLNSVQRKVFQGQDVPPPSTGGSPVVVGGSEAAALLSARIDALEQEQRRITGASEEINFKLDQMKSRLDKLVLDVDFRLTEIERRLGSAGAAGAANGAANAGAPASLSSPSTTNTTINQPSNTATVAEGGQLPEGTKMLGTLRANPNGEPISTPPAAVADPSAAAMANLAPEEQYNLAMGLIRKDDYAGAEQAFTNFLGQNSEHALAGNAQYWLGETFYVRGDYNNAASAFLNGYQNYPKSSKAADNLLKLGMTLGRMDQIEQACATFQQLSKQFKILPSRLEQIAAREKQKFNCS